MDLSIYYPTPLHSTTTHHRTTSHKHYCISLTAFLPYVFTYPTLPYSNNINIIQLHTRRNDKVISLHTRSTIFFASYDTRVSRLIIFPSRSWLASYCEVGSAFGSWSLNSLEAKEHLSIWLDIQQCAQGYSPLLEHSMVITDISSWLLGMQAFANIEMVPDEGAILKRKISWITPHSVARTDFRQHPSAPRSPITIFTLHLRY